MKLMQEVLHQERHHQIHQLVQLVMHLPLEMVQLANILLKKLKMNMKLIYGQFGEIWLNLGR
jgi:hypothetical protein